MLDVSYFFDQKQKIFIIQCVLLYFMKNPFFYLNNEFLNNFMKKAGEFVEKPKILSQTSILKALQILNDKFAAGFRLKIFPRIFMCIFEVSDLTHFWTKI